MAGVYVHIPFCRKACHYCNFHFSTSFKTKDDLLLALETEIKLRSDYLGEQNARTVYFGGGTPSALPVEDIDRVFHAVKSHIPLDPDPEVTLEANPDDINKETLAGWLATGINRLSIGVQAFQEDLLANWNRSHNAIQAMESIPMAQSAGYSNISADLIYGGSGLADEDWIRNMEALIRFGVPHISAYALTVESGTALAHQIRKGRTPAPDDEQSHRQFTLMQEILGAAGYEQYEVSNFAKPGFRSQHNTGYWSGAHYLGIGPSAHSYNGFSRQWNVSNNVKYFHALRNHIVPFEQELLTDADRYNELVMTGLRTSEGVDIKRLQMLGNFFVSYFEESANAFIADGKIYRNAHGNYALDPAYYFFADGIAAELFYKT